MPIFELEKDDLLNLSEGQLEELVARLSEAELSQAGHPISSVRWMGALTAPDGGVDVQVSVQTGHDVGDFVPRAETIFQVKKSSMPPSKISEEMTGKDNAKQMFERLEQVSGAFVIISLEDDNAPPNHKLRTDRMEQELSSLIKSASVHVDFYNRSQINQWLRQHVSVQLWARKVLGKSISCWRPLENWTNTPDDVDNSVIFKQGVTVGIPGQTSDLSLAEALPVTRDLIRKTSKAIRIAGLSGVGKTRFVQALFESVGEGEPLDKTRVIYADIGEGPDPSATNLLDTLIANKQEAILVLDNCPSELHGILAARIPQSKGNIKLVTVEYDIREDTPRTTEVVRIKAKGPDVAESLIARRFPQLAGPNARRIAEFSEGNCRLSLALADTVPVGDSLTDLSDDHLFERLFHQRHDLDKDLKEQAEVLSLVYSFSVEKQEEGIDELEVLGDLCEKSRRRMHRAAQTLVDRQIAQQRGRWRAVLPHAISNRLASDALRNIPTDELVSVFETKAGPRLLKSFGRRLGFLHDHEIARRIVGDWLTSGGVLNDIVGLNEHGSEMLMHVAPVAPDLVLEMIEAQSDGIVAAITTQTYHPRRRTIITLLSKVAYDPALFRRSLLVLLKIAVAENPSRQHDDAWSRIRPFFALLHSGTHASLEERLSFIDFCLRHSDAKVVEIGLSLVSETLRTEHFSGVDTSEFGARPRDFGLRPTFEESIHWLETCIGFAKGLATANDPKKKRYARDVLAKRFRELWRFKELRNSLTVMARELNGEFPWLEGWRAVRSILHTNRVSNKSKKASESDLALLDKLEEELKPTDLEGRIRSLVLSAGHRIWSLDDEFDTDEPEKYERSRERLSKQAFELGKDCIADPDLLERISDELFGTGYGPYKIDFGRGLIAGSEDSRTTWKLLLSLLKSKEVDNFGFGVLIGAIQEIANSDKAAASQILDECAKDELLRDCIVHLHPIEGFAEADFDRCVSVLRQTGLPLMGIGDLLWRTHFNVVSDSREIELSELILAGKNGANELLDAYSMKLHGQNKDADVLGPQHRRLGLIAATNVISQKQADPSGTKDHNMQQVLRACLRIDEHHKEKNALIDGLFERVSNSNGYFADFEATIQVIAEKMPKAFLDHALLDTSIDEYKRFGLFRNNVHETPPLAGIPPETLVQWCKEGKDTDRWGLLAKAISPFDEKSSESTTLSKQAVALMENCQDPMQVVKGFLDDLAPSSWSGSRADIVAERASAMSEYLEHKSEAIQDAASYFLHSAAQIEEQERDWERKHNADDPSFE